MTYILYGIGFFVLLGVMKSLRSGSTCSHGGCGHSHSQKSNATDADVQKLVQAGRKVEAIKLYRELHAVELVVAKQAIDKMDSGVAT